MNELIVDKDGLIPSLPSDESWETAVKDKPDQIRDAAIACRSALRTCREQTNSFDVISKAILLLLKQNTTPNTIKSLKLELDNLQAIFPVIVDKAQEYFDSFHTLETIIGKQSREDPSYNLRQLWLSVSQKKRRTTCRLCMGESEEECSERT